jgi:hypothetical protein
MDTAYRTAIVACLSDERFAEYVRRSAGDDERAPRLYRINIALSAELFKGISWLEIALRNALNREMSTQFGPEWYDRHDIGLSLESLRLISNAVRFLTDRRRPVTAGRVVAGLTLGFWVKLLGPGYKNRNEEFFWRPALYRAFPHVRSDPKIARFTRQSVFVPLNDTILEMRNRIAHHEPIYYRGELLRDFNEVIRVAGWIDPNLSHTIASNTAFVDLYGKLTRDWRDRSYVVDPSF